MCYLLMDLTKDSVEDCAKDGGNELFAKLHCAHS